MVYSNKTRGLVITPSACHLSLFLLDYVDRVLDVLWTGDHTVPVLCGLVLTPPQCVVDLIGCFVDR